MKEELQALARICHICHHKNRVANHQVGDQAWLCERCFRLRDKDKAAPFVDWSRRETIDSLTESMHFFAELYRSQDYRTFHLVKQIYGDRGAVCNLLEMVRDTVDPLGVSWTKYHRYYQLFNRRYLEHGDQVFERASHMHGLWQTIHKNVLDEAVLATLTNKFKDNTVIVIVMQNKTVWYINPRLLQIFAYEYETYNPKEGGVSVPISKEKIIDYIDPFFGLIQE